ncbi:unnamed protein product [Vitrella brassicaformis CCMP3155]|uniref:Uncharacterized protein n=1 Tax=Vitrella brassicaformis (strain CCMP3155) TaxID=1169540 RepID=A0A0G4GMB4_VITBC|nr:unnamed protein product [Vitrella brassicaformis CCMP3155]|eukprot:CEM31325.1 unnamed protein product [Vitrella brassicaformis CCMP3155]
MRNGKENIVLARGVLDHTVLDLKQYILETVGYTAGFREAREIQFVNCGDCAEDRTLREVFGATGLGMSHLRPFIIHTHCAYTPAAPTAVDESRRDERIRSCCACVDPSASVEPEREPEVEVRHRCIQGR